MKKVLFGEIEFGEMHKGKDVFPIAIIHGIFEECYFRDDSNQIDNHMIENGHDGYLLPDEFKGEIVYSKTFMKRLGS